MEKSVGELAVFLSGSAVGDENVPISGIGSLDEACIGQITFLANPKYAGKVATTGASAVVLPPGADRHGRTAIVVQNPYLAFAKLLTLFHVRPPECRGISGNAFIGKNVQIGKEVTIHPGVSVGDNVVLGDRVVLHPGVVLYEGAYLGDDVVLHAHVSVRERCRIGNRVTVHNGTVIGADGFGYAPDGPGWYKIPQIGIVVIEDDVEIGANSAIDRAALNVTRIGQGTKIDNLVQIAHNCILGENCMIAGQVGVAGSVTMGTHVTVGGNTGIGGHIRIGDNAMVGGMSGVAGSVPPGETVSGIPTMPHKEWLRAVGVVPKLPELRKTVNSLEKRIVELEQQLARLQVN